MPYDVPHKLFLQVLTQKRIMTTADVKSTFQRICQKFNLTDVSLRDFMVEINEQIEKVHLIVKKGIIEENDGDKQCYVIHNTVDTEATRLNCVYSQTDLPYLKKVIEAIIVSPVGCIRLIEALNFESTKRLADREAMLQHMVQDKWFLEEHGHLSISPLLAVELQPYLEEKFSQFCHKCSFCKMLVFRGMTCSQCSTSGHRNCFKTYWSKTKKTPSCPNRACGIEWPEALNSINSN